MNNQKKEYITEEEFVRRILSNEIQGGMDLLKTYLDIYAESIFTIIKSKSFRYAKKYQVFALIELLEHTSQVKFDGTLFNYKNGIIILPRKLEGHYKDTKDNYRKAMDKSILKTFRVKLSNELLENIVENCYIKLKENSTSKLTLEEELNSSNRYEYRKGLNKLLTKIRNSISEEVVLPISKSDYIKMKVDYVLTENTEDICNCGRCETPSKIIYTAKVPSEDWLYLCHKCFRDLNCKLGVNKGQLLIPKEIKFNNESLFKFKEYRRDNVPR